MKKVLLLTVLIVLMGCESEETKIRKIKLCTEFSKDGENKLHAINTEIWEKGTILKVFFLNGDSFLQEKVIKYASEWTLYSGIKFQFINQGTADIRVGFYPNKGSWSIIGKSAAAYSVDLNTGKMYPSNRGITMNFGWFDHSTEEKEFSRTILHEFGHALGLIHEHQAPDAGIKWNENVYQYYKLTQGWNKEEVDNNIIYKYNEDMVRGGEYDKTSIMHYSIPREVLEDESQQFYENYYLSLQDKTDIKEIYSN